MQILFADGAGRLAQKKKNNKNKKGWALTGADGNQVNFSNLNAEQNDEWSQDASI